MLHGGIGANWTLTSLNSIAAPTRACIVDAHMCIYIISILALCMLHILVTIAICIHTLPNHALCDAPSGALYLWSICEVPNDDDLRCTNCNLYTSTEIPRDATETQTSERENEDCSNYHDYYLHWADHLDSINKTRKAPKMGKLDQTRTTDAEDQNTQTKSNSRNETAVMSH